MLDTSNTNFTVTKDVQILACANAAHGIEDCVNPEGADIKIDDDQYVFPDAIKEFGIPGHQLFAVSRPNWLEEFQSRYITFTRPPADDIYKNVLLPLDDYLEVRRNIQDREGAKACAGDVLCNDGPSFVYFSDLITNRLDDYNIIP